MYAGNGVAGATRGETYRAVKLGRRRRRKNNLRKTPCWARAPQNAQTCCVHAPFSVCEEGRNEVGDLVALAVGRMRAVRFKKCVWWSVRELRRGQGVHLFHACLKKFFLFSLCGEGRVEREAAMVLVGVFPPFGK